VLSKTVFSIAWSTFWMYSVMAIFKSSYTVRDNRLWTVWYRVIKKSLCTWWLQYSKLQVMFKVSPASLQTFIDMPNCGFEDRVQYSTVHIPNVFCDGHLKIINCVGIVRIQLLPHYLAQSDCLAANRQDQEDTRLTLTPSVIPNSDYVIMVSDWNCLTFKSLAVSLRTTRFSIQNFYMLLALR
jgi:hypothetical protein